MALVALCAGLGFTTFADLVTATVGTEHGEEYHDILLLKKALAWHTGWQKCKSETRPTVFATKPLHPDVIGRTLHKYARKIGLDRGYSAHSMRATFITTALDNGASLEDVQRAAGHADPSTTKLYDRRGYNPEKSASFFANY